MTFVLIFALIFAVTVTAHPGHGTPEIIESDPGTGSTTDTGGSTYTGGSDSGGTSSASSAQSSTTVSQTGGGSDTGAQSTGSTNNQVATSSTPITSYSSPGGPAALVGLMVVLSLIAFSFPFKNSSLRRFQENFGF